MAFNTLRGTVNFSNATTGTIESMVDDYSNQTLAGGKTFAQKLTASAISLAGSTLEHPAITAISGDAASRLFVSDGDGTVTCTAALVFSNSSLTASYYSGSAIGLTSVNLAPHKVSGQLSASNLFYGVGLSASQGNAIAVSGGVGIASTAQGVYVDLPSNSGLNFSSDKLIVDPNNATTKGSWSASDEVLIADSDASSALKKATVTTLATYMQNTLTFTAPGGDDNNIQTKSGTSFAGSNNLKFDGTKITLAGDMSGSGYISASYFVGDGSGLVNVSDQYSPGGSDTAVQFHSGSTFSGSAKLLFQYAESTPVLKLTGEFSASSEATVGGLDVFHEGIKRAYLSSSGEVSASAALSASAVHTLNTVINAAHLSSSLNVSGSAFYGDGNKLNNVPISGYTNTRLVFCGATTDTLATYDGLTWSNPLMSVPGTVSATNLSASTLVSASAFYGDGSGLTNVGSDPGGGNTAVQFNSGSTLSGSSKLLFDYAASTAALILTGTLESTGRLVATNDISASLTLAGRNLVIGEGQTLGTDTVAGENLLTLIGHRLTVDGEISVAALSSSAQISGSSLKTNHTTIDSSHVSSSLNISGSAFYGDGSNLTGLSAGAVSSYTNSGDNRIITSVNSSTINGEPFLTFDGTVLDLTGQMSASLGVTGSSLHTVATVINPTHISSSLNISGSAFYGDGSKLSGISVTPGGSDNQVQFNDDGGFGGNANLTFVGNSALRVTGSVAVTGSGVEALTIIDGTHVSSSLNISGSAFYGDGSNLTGLSAGAVSSYTNSGDNRIITSVNSSTINGEANLSFDGSTLMVTGALEASSRITSTNDISSSLTLAGRNLVIGEGQTLGTDTVAGENLLTLIGHRLTIDGQLSVGALSSSAQISGSSLKTDHTAIDSSHVSSSLNISGSSFYGDGSNLTGLPSAAITTYDNAANNRIITSLDASAVNAEANLTFNGSLMTVLGAVTASLGVTGSALKAGGTIIDALHVSSSLNISGSSFYGDGSNLTGIAGGGAVETYTNAANNRIITSVNSTTINGEAALSFNGTVLEVAGEVSASSTVSGSRFYGEGGSITYDGRNKELVFYTSGTLSGDGGLYLEPGSAGTETAVLVVGTQLSSSQTISASFFYGNGGNLTGLPGSTPATASGGTGGIQFAKTTDGEFMSDGAFVFNTGSSGAQGAYLTASNVRVDYTTHLTGALYRGYRIEVAHYTLTKTDSYVYMAQNNPLGSALTGTLPAASTVNGIIYTIKNVGTGGKNVQVTASSGDRFDGIDGAKELAPSDAITIQSINGNTWAISSMYP